MITERRTQILVIIITHYGMTPTIIQSKLNTFEMFTGQNVSQSNSFNCFNDSITNCPVVSWARHWPRRFEFNSHYHPMGHCFVAKESEHEWEKGNSNIIGKHLFSNQNTVIMVSFFFLIQTLLLFIYHLDYAKTCGIMEWNPPSLPFKLHSNRSTFLLQVAHFEISVKDINYSQHETTQCLEWALRMAKTWKTTFQK